MCVKRMSSCSCLHGSFFTVCHPYIDVATFLEMFFLWDLFLPFGGGGGIFLS